MPPPPPSRRTRGGARAAGAGHGRAGLHWGGCRVPGSHRVTLALTTYVTNRGTPCTGSLTTERSSGTPHTAHLRRAERGPPVCLLWLSLAAGPGGDVTATRHPGPCKRTENPEGNPGALLGRVRGRGQGGAAGKPGLGSTLRSLRSRWRSSEPRMSCRVKVSLYSQRLRCSSQAATSSVPQRCTVGDGEAGAQ